MSVSARYGFPYVIEIKYGKAYVKE